MSRRFFGFLLLVVCALATTACDFLADYEEREEIRQTFALQANGRVTVENTNGSIRVQGWDQPQVEVVATKTVRGFDQKDAKERLRQLEVVIKHDSYLVSVYTRYPRRVNWSGGVSYELRIPRNANLSLESTNGALVANNVEGQLRFETTNGSITGDDLAGMLRARTTNGGITLDMRKAVTGDIRVKTTNGGIRLSLPADINADVSARTTNGRIATDFPIEVRGTLGRTSLEGKIGRGGSLIELSTTNGSIRINRQGD